MSENRELWGSKSRRKRIIYLYAPLLLICAFLILVFRSILPMKILLLIVSLDGFFNGIELLKLRRAYLTKGEKGKARDIGTLGGLIILTMTAMVGFLIWLIIITPIRLW
jgi:hypothetical protein